MQGIIIAGGMGTRFRPLTYIRPKPLIPVVNKPLLEYQVEQLRLHGVDRIVFATNYLAEKIEEHFGDGSRFGVEMRYAIEESPLGTGGAIRNAARQLWHQEDFVVFNGDIVCGFDLQQIIAFHLAKSSTCTIALTPIPRPNPFGKIVIDSDMCIQSWTEPSEAEKKKLAAMDPDTSLHEGDDYINAGFYVISPKLLDYIPYDRPVSFERETFPTLMDHDERLYAMPMDGYWTDVGRPSQLMDVTAALLAGRLPGQRPNPISGLAQVSTEGLLSGSVVIADGCVVEVGAKLTDTVLMPDVRIGAHSILNNCIIDSECIIGPSATLDGVVLGAGSRITQGTQLKGVLANEANA
ncbi:MAG: sugar phosphate nucleotidyltransferase [Armatimonadota bacterium]